MVQPLPYLRETPSQTAGPYVHIGLAPEAAGFTVYAGALGAVIAGPATPGPRIRVAGRVLDGFGTAVKDAVIEVWQADAQGRWADGTGDFRGWGRVIPDFASGEFAFETVRPGRVGAHAPHLSLWIVARGINVGLQTRLYLPEDDHAGDPVLSRIEHGARRATLVAAAEGPGAYRFDIHLQGEGETVFLDV